MKGFRATYTLPQTWWFNLEFFHFYNNIIAFSYNHPIFHFSAVLVKLHYLPFAVNRFCVKWFCLSEYKYLEHVYTDSCVFRGLQYPQLRIFWGSWDVIIQNQYTHRLLWDNWDTPFEGKRLVKWEHCW